MKKLVLFTKDEDKIGEVYEVDDDLIIKGNHIKWQSGSLHGLRVKFAVLPHEIEIKEGDPITAEIKSQDQQANYFYTKEEKQKADMQIMINNIVLDQVEINKQLKQTQGMLNRMMLGGKA